MIAARAATRAVVSCSLPARSRSVPAGNRSSTVAPKSITRPRSVAAKASDMERLMAMMMGPKGKMVDPADALPGRDIEMMVTDKHYVLGNPIKGTPEGLEECVFATGCFWGTEKMFWRIPGVYSTSVGYAAGYTPNPTYEEACSGQSGHTEAVRIVWDPKVITYADLLSMHWTSHNPTQGMAQGNDTGTQYRSGIYCSTEEQYKVAMESKEVYQKALSAAGKGEITTEINGPEGNTVYYFAEDYHQQYLAKPGARPYCSAQPTGVPVPGEWLASQGAKLSTGYWSMYGPRPGCTIQVSNDPIPLAEALKA